MTDKNGAAAINRRDAISIIAVTAALGAALTGAQPIVTVTGASALDKETAGNPQNAGEATQSLENLAAKDFESLIGEKFTIGGEEATLSEVRHGHRSPGQLRQQFSLTFDVSWDLPIDADIMPFSHPAIGRHELLVTHVNGAGSGTLEICFS